MGQNEGRADEEGKKDVGHRAKKDVDVPAEGMAIFFVSVNWYDIGSGKILKPTKRLQCFSISSSRVRGPPHHQCMRRL